MGARISGAQAMSDNFHYFPPRPGVNVFDNDKERVKAAVMKEAESFCKMIDCAEEPVALRADVSRYGVNVIIDVSIEE